MSNKIEHDNKEHDKPDIADVSSKISECNVADFEIKTTSPSCRKELFPINMYPTTTSTGKPMKVYTCGDTIINACNNKLQESLEYFIVLEDYLQECNDTERVHAIDTEEIETIFDLIQKLNDMYENCCTLIENNDKNV